MSGVFVLTEDGKLIEMSEKQFESEDDFQELVAKYPSLLPGDQISTFSPRKWLLISREMGVPSEESGSDRWALDHLLLDQDAIPTFAELKRSSDTRIRREVVGQMMDYAANGSVYWSVEKMKVAFEKNCEFEGIDPTERLHEFLVDDCDSDEFWQRVKTNLQAGRIRLLFVADEIPDELRRIVEFLNGQMDPAEVLAVELGLFEGKGMRTIVPHVYGHTMEAERKKRSGGIKKPALNDEEFLTRLYESAGSEVATVARRILEWTREKMGEPRWGSSSFTAFTTRNGKRPSLFYVWDTGHCGVLIGRLAEHPPFDNETKILQFVERLNRIPGVNIDPLRKEPGFKLKVLCDDESLNQFFDVMSWALLEIDSATTPKEH